MWYTILEVLMYKLDKHVKIKELLTLICALICDVHDNEIKKFNGIIK